VFDPLERDSGEILCALHQRPGGWLPPGRLAFRMPAGPGSQGRGFFVGALFSLERSDVEAARGLSATHMLRALVVTTPVVVCGVGGRTVEVSVEFQVFAQ
jgi:hypothetical protein